MADARLYCRQRGDGYWKLRRTKNDPDVLGTGHGQSGRQTTSRELPTFLPKLAASPHRQNMCNILTFYFQGSVELKLMERFNDHCCVNQEDITKWRTASKRGNALHAEWFNPSLTAQRILEEMVAVCTPVDPEQ